MLRTASILEQVINPQVGNLTPDVAQYILSLDFPPAVHARYAELSEKAQEGTLSPTEKNELDDILVADAVVLTGG